MAAGCSIALLAAATQTKQAKSFPKPLDPKA